MKLRILLLSLLIPSISFAMTTWPSRYVMGELPLSTLNQVRSLSDVYDCGEIEHQRFCGFDTKYRGIPMVAEIDVVNQSVARVSFFIPMTVTNYTRLQTLLRSDGYQLKSVKIAGKELIVEDLINQDLPHIADKKLIEFLNLYPISESKLFTWIRKNEIHNTLATETLLMTSDKEQIMLTWDFPQLSNTVTQ
ncbi:hypothetical protein ACWX0P_25175 [Vibrio mediterranei]